MLTFFTKSQQEKCGGSQKSVYFLTFTTVFLCSKKTIQIEILCLLRIFPFLSEGFHL